MAHRVLLMGATPRPSLSFYPVPDCSGANDASHALDLGLVPELQLDPPPPSSSPPTAENTIYMPDPADFHPYGLPTLDEFAAMQPLSGELWVKVTPVERILRRAILAETGVEEGPGDMRELGLRNVSAAIVCTKAEMMPSCHLACS